MALVLDALHGQCVVPFATRCPISIIPPNRSSTFSDWYEVRPFLFSISRISSMILLSFGEQVWLGESRFSSARTGPKGRKLVEKVKVMLRELQQSEADDCQGFG